MSKMQRTKGAVFEREVAKRFSDELGIEVKRLIGQSRDGGNDMDAGVLCIEAKRRASLKGLRGWLTQAWMAAQDRARRAEIAGQPSAAAYHVPIVVMREDGGDEPMVLLGMTDFFTLTRGRLL